jgi:hypothetical protein
MRARSWANGRRSPDILEVKGCLLIVCDTQVWRRVESLCGTLPKP